jgi:hypothetical protein
MNKEIALRDFESTFSELEKVVLLFNNDHYNKVPFEGSWTAAQVVQHIVLSSSGFAQILNAEVKETDRPIDELLPKLKSIFLDFTSKMKSPDFILPELKNYDEEQHLSIVKSLKYEIGKAISDLSLDKTCLAFELPNLGCLTRLESVYFVVYHTQRHTHQLREIDRVIKSLS